MYLVEYIIKNCKSFNSHWEISRSNLPQNCQLIQSVTTKHGEVAIAIWEAPSEKVLYEFHKKYFDKVSNWKLYELDQYHVEGINLKKSA